MYKVGGFFQSEEQEERVLEALLMFIFLWEPYKPLTGREQALFPFLPVALIVDWEYCNTQFTAVSGLESFVWDPAVSPPASLPPSRLLGFRDFVSLLQVTRKLAWCLQVGRVISSKIFCIPSCGWEDYSRELFRSPVAMEMPSVPPPWIKPALLAPVACFCPGAAILGLSY